MQFLYNVGLVLTAFNWLVDRYVFDMTIKASPKLMFMFFRVFLAERSVAT